MIVVNVKFYHTRSNGFTDVVRLILFRRTWSEQRCLNYLFTVKSRPPGAMHLREHGHNFITPDNKYEFNERHFIAFWLWLNFMCLFYVHVHVFYVI